jgi:hypothetical protein
MSENTTEMMRLCFEKIDAGGDDAQFFQRVHDALMEARHESGMIGRLDEARVWLAKWHEPQATGWGTRRIEMLQRSLETKGIIVRWGNNNDIGQLARSLRRLRAPQSRLMLLRPLGLPGYLFADVRVTLRQSVLGMPHCGSNDRNLSGPSPIAFRSGLK